MTAAVNFPLSARAPGPRVRQRPCRARRTRRNAGTPESSDGRIDDHTQRPSPPAARQEAPDEALVARDEALIARDETLIAEDEALIAQIATGDADAFSVLLSRHLDPIHAYLHRLSRSRADAEDLAQETFLKVWHKAGTYRPGRVKPSTWLHTIAHNLCIDAHRRRRDTDTATPPEPVDELADPARRASDAEQQRRLEAALAELPDNQRSAILLCQLQGFSNVQAAQILGVKVRALESLLARARRALRTELTDHGEI